MAKQNKKKKQPKSFGESCQCVSTALKDSIKEAKISYIIVICILITMLIFQVISSRPSNKKIAKWIDQNPEIILNSVNKFVTQKQKEMMEERQKTAKEGIKTKKAEILDSKYSGVINPKGSITIVEFFDYNCGYCRHVAKIVEQVAKEEKNVKFVFKELPIMGENSRIAAKTAIAISMMSPSKYKVYHTSLMESGARSEADIKKAVSKAGLKYSEIEKFLKKNSNEIDQAISKNLELASSIGINGTPAFVIGEELVPGALDYNSLKDLINKAKK
jgi:protein-disulfide isomerase